MTLETVKGIVELIAAGSMFILPCVVFWHRVKTDSVGLSSRTLQFCAISMLVPVLLILGQTEAVDKATLGTLVGGLMGYVLGSGGPGRNDLDKSN